MHLQMNSNGSFNSSPGHPPQASSSASQAQLNTTPETTQSHSDSSYLYPPVSMLPPPPPLPPGTVPTFHSPPSFQLSAPPRTLEPSTGMPLPPPPPPPPPRSSPPLVASNACEKPDVESSKQSFSIHCDESSLPFEKAENRFPLCTDPDIEMEDDITLPEIDDGSRQASSSPYSGRAKIVAGDMYDPFVDSFEPAPVELDRVKEEPEPANDSVPKASVSSNRPLDMDDKQTLSESDMTARASVSSNRPPDAEENTIGNQVGAVASGDDDEFGENTEKEREGNSYETVSPYSHNENPKASNNLDEVDSSTRKSSRGDPKEKESSSRSMRLFKVVLTKFVKDLLKPSWRQGNMSKEAFKTIVKRAVEKVSNSMEGRRVPKSRAKIDKYVDSSRHKLTKLVMGYVDKYAKA